jgi:hypothetical protein
MYSSQERPPRGGYQERYAARDMDTERDGPARPAMKSARGRAPVGRRIFRTLFRFVLTVLLGIAATLSWQSHGEQAKAMVAVWAPSLSPLVAVLPTTAPVAVAASARPAQQFEPVARELAVLRRGMGLLAAKQEQMLATLSTIERPPSALPSWAVPIVPSRPQAPAARSQAMPPPAPAPRPLALDRVGNVRP